MKTWHKVAAGAAVGFAAGVVLVNVAGLPTFGFVGKLYERAKKQFGTEIRKQVEAGN